MEHHRQRQDHQEEYESGLEVVAAAAPSPWRPNDVPLPEVAPYAHSHSDVDAKAAQLPLVADNALAWDRYHKHNPGLEVVVVPAYGPGDQRKLCGVRRKPCYVVIAVAVVIVVAAVAIGVGVGLAVARRSQGDSGGSGPTNLESTKDAKITCPAEDNVTFSAQDHPDRHFRLICGHDFNSQDGAMDLASANTTTMAACIDLCAARPECVGAGWGDYYGNRICWMKSLLGEMNTSGNWLFAVDVDKTSV
ncbi:hypothetical protein LX32DRAFT_596020 [Colletotrichum zoysiae]|uniref:Apple domain-containing protein n=1 Tax=Colletotrichum zoysiae TaxID=1216348 RepID=A0AAD9LYP9_9PEZI|nr:hypothetical protein LX32DRAFT_596020 [Colletotrichum zoysiae]